MPRVFPRGLKLIDNPGFLLELKLRPPESILFIALSQRVKPCSDENELLNVRLSVRERRES